MSTIKVNQSHSLSQEEAKERLGVFESQLSKYGAKLDWKGYSAKIKGMGVSGGAEVTGDNVEVTVKLGMMAKAAGVDAERLKGSIAKRLEEAYKA